MSHIRMMAAAQPFLSGAISKTVNMPNESTVGEIENVYREAWKMGVKAVAIYRDGSKMAQVLSSNSTEVKDSASLATGAQVGQHGRELLYTREDLEAAVAQAISLMPAKKRKMPQRRRGLTIEARVGGQKVYLRTGEYVDGRLGEIFIDMQKEGATLRSLLNCFAISVSMGLQYGVPLEDFVEKFTFTRFEPSGMVDHPNVKTATSLLDYVFRVLGMEYMGKTDFVHVQPNLSDLALNRAKDASVVAQMDLPMEKSAMPNSVHYSESSVADDAMNQHLSSMMGDAPMCTTCGHVTVRNGSCYRCLNCGNSMGCS
jgi:ribonucleoside-diphosphate reductase alpha chain